MALPSSYVNSANQQIQLDSFGSSEDFFAQILTNDIRKLVLSDDIQFTPTLIKSLIEKLLNATTLETLTFHNIGCQAILDILKALKNNYTIININITYDDTVNSEYIGNIDILRTVLLRPILERNLILARLVQNENLVQRIDWNLNNPEPNINRRVYLYLTDFDNMGFQADDPVVGSDINQLRLSYNTLMTTGLMPALNVFGMTPFNVRPEFLPPSPWQQQQQPAFAPAMEVPSLSTLGLSGIENILPSPRPAAVAGNVDLQQQPPPEVLPIPSAPFQDPFGTVTHDNINSQQQQPRASSSSSSSRSSLEQLWQMESEEQAYIWGREQQQQQQQRSWDWFRWVFTWATDRG